MPTVNQTSERQKQLHSSEIASSGAVQAYRLMLAGSKDVERNLQITVILVSIIVILMAALPEDLTISVEFIGLKIERFRAHSEILTLILAYGVYRIGSLSSELMAYFIKLGTFADLQFSDDSQVLIDVVQPTSRALDRAIGEKSDLYHLLTQIQRLILIAILALAAMMGASLAIIKIIQNLSEPNLPTPQSWFFSISASLLLVWFVVGLTKLVVFFSRAFGPAILRTFRSK